MFSEVTVLAVNNDHKLTVPSKGSDAEVKLGTNHLTCFPPDFDLHESETEQEEKPAESPPPLPASQSNADDDSEGTAAQKKGEVHTATVEQRRRLFSFPKPQETDRPDVQLLSNEDFTKLASPAKAPEHMQIEPGTPLLDAFAGPDLFSQEVFSHVTGSGVLALPGIEPPGGQSALLSGPVRCGRLDWILNECRVSRQ
jgi:hypothetical protein